MKSEDKGDRRHYFRQIGRNRFQATGLVGGAWNLSEQHIAPALGLLAHAIERDLEARRPGELAFGCLSYDILGTLPIGVMEIDVVVLRPGRTIELIEARLSHDGRPAVIVRAWMLQRFETASIAGGSFDPIPGPEGMEPFDMASLWAGECVRSVEVRRIQEAPGRAISWVRTDVGLVDIGPTTGTARALGMVDMANGVATRRNPAEVAFPNVDLTVHLFRRVEGEWIGLDTRVSFGEAGVGLTHSVLHDRVGPVGSVAQSLTVRPQ